MSDYQVLREKAASQRRDVERALTRFMAKTGETQSLFKDDVSTFPCENLPSVDPVLSFEIIPASPLSLSMAGRNRSALFLSWVHLVLQISGSFSQGLRAWSLTDDSE